MKKTRHSRKYDQLLTALRQARKTSGLTQLEVAKKFGAHPSFVSKCESGERRIDVVEALEFCRLYGISLASLLQQAGLE